MLTLERLEKAFTGRRPGPQNVRSRYAVLAPLVEKEGGELQLLFEVRADTLDRQPGEVCFPGGRIEPGESREECVLRETREELGIPEKAVRIIGPLDYIQHTANFMMYPLLGLVEAEAAAAVKPNPAEVKETFLVPLSFFEKTPPEIYHYELIPRPEENFPDARLGFPDGYPWQQGRRSVPIYEYEGHVIWGLTGHIVRWLVTYMARTEKRSAGQHQVSERRSK
ncbi:MAG: CoA pyrophosphatase [Bacillota bacterium]|nr:CoA pyrophosphatase [Bacillota bacterium]